MKICTKIVKFEFREKNQYIFNRILLFSMLSGSSFSTYFLAAKLELIIKGFLSTPFIVTGNSSLSIDERESLKFVKLFFKKTHSLVVKYRSNF